MRSKVEIKIPRVSRKAARLRMGHPLLRSPFLYGPLLSSLVTLF